MVEVGKTKTKQHTIYDTRKYLYTLIEDTSGKRIM